MTPMVPPAPEGFDLRAWFAGCAMANHNVVSTRDPEKAVQKAYEVADQMLTALKANQGPYVDPAKKSDEPSTGEASPQGATIPAPALHKRTSTEVFPTRIPDPNKNSENAKAHPGYYSRVDGEYEKVI